VPRPVGRHLQVFLDRQVAEDAPAFGNIADAERGDGVGRPVGRRLAEDAHHALARVGKSYEAAQRRRLAGSIATEERDEFALGHAEADAVEDMALAVEAVDGLDVERVHAALPR